MTLQQQQQKLQGQSLAIYKPYNKILLTQKSPFNNKNQSIPTILQTS